MIDWSRLEFFPDWGREARARRRLKREGRIEFASRDAIYFSATAAHANEMQLWAVFFLLGAVALLGASATFLADHLSYFFEVRLPAVRLVLLVICGVSCLLSLRCVVMTFRLQRDWREAANRHTARTETP